MAQADLHDADFVAGRVIALQADLARERERSDLVVIALRGMREEVQSLTSEVVRQGGVSARTAALTERIARALDVDPEALPDAPVIRIPRSPRADSAIEDLERIPTRVDREELERRPAPKSSLPITRSFRPTDLRGWVRLVVYAVLAVAGLGAAIRELAAALAGR